MNAQQLRLCFTITTLCSLPAVAVQAASNEEGCATPVIESPADAIVLAVRPVITWSAVEGAEHYRVQVTLRVPEGPLLGSLDLISREPRFELPHPLTANRVLLVARVSAFCKDRGYGPASDPAKGGRFLAIGGQDCPAPERISGSISGGNAQLQWDKVAPATGYEVARHDIQNGRPIEAVQIAQPRHAMPLQVGETGVFAVRSLCGARAGPWSYAVLR